MSQDVLPGCVFCSQFAYWIACVYFTYSMSATFIEIFSQTTLLFFFFTEWFFAKIVCISSMEKEAKHFVGVVDPLFCMFTKAETLLPHQIQHECRFKICCTLPAIDVFLRHLTDKPLFWQFNNSFLKNIFFQNVFQGFFRCPSRYGARIAANQKRRCLTSML